MQSLSIVSTLYRSEEFLKELYKRLVVVAEACTDDFEIIFVDDGSPDRSLDLAVELAEQDERVRVVELSRNFGHHPAMLAGLSFAIGDRIFLIDSDLEEAPEYLSEFWESMSSKGLDVIYGVQAERLRGGRLERILGSVFYRVFNFCSPTPIPVNLCTIRLMTRQYTEAVLEMGDKNLFLGGQFAWVGFRQQPCVIEVVPVRKASNYSMLKKLSLCSDAIFSFSSYPIKLIFTLGLQLFFLSSCWGVYLFVRKLIYPSLILTGWSSVMVSIWFLGSVIILILGLIGMYISKIFDEVKDRQRYIVRKVHGVGTDGGAGSAIIVSEATVKETLSVS